MAQKKFVVSVGDAYFYDKCDAGYANPFTLVKDADALTGAATLDVKTAMVRAETAVDTSITTTIQNVDTRGGFGNKLLNIYYHSAELTIACTDAQFNMLAIKALVGDDNYLEAGIENNYILIKADYIPKTMELFIVAQLAGALASGCSGLIGSILIHVPLATLNGAVNIALTADGVANTPFEARALEAANGEYAYIYEFGVRTHTRNTTTGDIEMVNFATRDADV